MNWCVSRWPRAARVQHQSAWRSVSGSCGAQSPGLRLVVSYADMKEGHLGTIYQATNWLYLGASKQSYLKVRGKIEHPRSLYDRFGPKGQSVPWLQAHVDPRAQRVAMPAKLKYVWPLDRTLRPELENDRETVSETRRKHRWRCAWWTNQERAVPVRPRRSIQPRDESMARRNTSPKTKLTAEVQEQIVSAIRAGNYTQVCRGVCGRL